MLSIQITSLKGKKPTPKVILDHLKQLPENGNVWLKRPEAVSKLQAIAGIECSGYVNWSTAICLSDQVFSKKLENLEYAVALPFMY